LEYQDGFIPGGTGSFSPVPPVPQHTQDHSTARRLFPAPLVSVHPEITNLFEIKAYGKFNHRQMVDILRIKFFAQRRYQANWPFLDGH
jgi:hypothetical protein